MLESFHLAADDVPAVVFGLVISAVVLAGWWLAEKRHEWRSAKP